MRNGDRMMSLFGALGGAQNFATAISCPLQIEPQIWDLDLVLQTTVLISSRPRQLLKGE